jgi:hypothetical protein
MIPDLDDVVRAITTGRLVVFLGAGANICSRPDKMEWQPGQTEHLPLGAELAKYLAQIFHYPFHTPKDPKDSAPDLDLARVAQWIDLEQGIGPLYDELHALFDAEYPPTVLHEFLAWLPASLRSKGYPRLKESISRRFLIVTTNYDDLLERAFAHENEPLHVVSYRRGKDSSEPISFYHRAPGATESEPIYNVNDYQLLLDDQHAILLKVHGAVDRKDSEGDCFVITEDHYLDYIDFTPAEVNSIFPAPLPALLLKNHLLFLGYALKDWNLRIILRRIWRERIHSRVSWSIQYKADEHDSLFWRHNRVNIRNWPLSDYIEALWERIKELPSLSGGTPT